MRTSLHSALVAAQGTWVLRRDDAGGFAAVPPFPDWVSRLEATSGAGTGPVPVFEAFPFLESFRPEAEAHWLSGTGESRASGLWTEPAPDGEELHFEATALRLEEGAFLLIRRWEEAFRRRQDLLQLARERMLEHEKLAREASAKEILLHCIVHDLSGPLTGIQGCLAVLERAGLSPAETEYVRLALMQTERQQQLIQELLDVFAAEVGAVRSAGLPGGPTPDLLGCVAGVIEGFRPAFQSKRVDLRTSFPPGWCAPWPVQAESSRLERVFHNLLQNALRHGPSGTAVVVGIQEAGDGYGVTVEDQGPGVPADIRPRLFQRFVAGGGTGQCGLGLFYCRITLERWGGTIGYEDRSGGGARFRCWLRKAGEWGVARGLPSGKCPP